MNCFDNANLLVSRKTNIAAVIILLALLTGYGISPVLQAGETAQAVVKTAFGADCENMIIRELDGAKKDVMVAIYSLTRRKINSAFVKAVRRGVKVTVKYDAGQEEIDAMKESIGYLKEHGVKCIPVKMTGDYAAMHHKFVVIDRQLVLTGSYNYTVPATELNYENVVSIDSPEVAAAFTREFERIKDR